MPDGYVGRDAGKTNLVGMTREELARVVTDLGESEPSAKMRATQLWRWIYYRGARGFDEMTSVPKSLRATLEETCQIGRATIVRNQLSADGTHKWLVRYSDGEEVESVLIPEGDRGALCLSTQVGLYADLQILPHRHATAGAQPRRGRDRGPTAGGARRAGRVAVAQKRTDPVERRCHGYGRAALQL